MRTAASTFMEHGFLKRNTTVLKWALRSRLFEHRPGNMTIKSFAYKLHRLASSLVDFHEDDAALQDMLQADGFTLTAAVFDVLNTVVRDFNRDCGITDPERRRFLMDLQREYITPDRQRYEPILTQAHTSFPDDRQARTQYISQHWQFGIAPPNEMTPLPICHTKATFVQYDKKVLEEVFPALRGHIEGPWGFQTYMDPFSKTANIPCLKSGTNRCAKSEAQMLRAMKHINPSSVCPWMVGCSFKTDGIQMKLLLHTSDVSRPGVSGLKQLSLAGYTGDFKAHTLSEIVDSGTGIYPLKLVSGQTADLIDVNITALDPGQVLIVDGPRATGEAFTRENVAALMDLEDAERCSYSATLYKIKTLQLISGVKEQIRRVGSYAASLAGLMVRKKTAVTAEFMQYCKQYASSSENLWTELLTTQRRSNNFKRFSAVQSAVDDIAETIAAPKRQQNSVRRLVFFGAASFAAAKGASSAPCKKIVRALCQRAAVVMVPEEWTSQTCPGCNRRLQDGPDYRTKLCQTEIGHCPLHLDTPSRILARDSVGSLNIGFRGIYKSTGREAVDQPVDLVTE